MEMFLLLIISLLTLFVSVSSYNVPAIFTFGDSIFDAGNNHFIKNCTAQADFPPYGSTFFHYPTGRFTNGRTVADFVAQFIGLDLQKPYLQVEMEIVKGIRRSYPSNGVNFASAGSGVLRETNMDLVSHVPIPCRYVTGTAFHAHQLSFLTFNVGVTQGVMSIQKQLQQFQTLRKLNKIDKKLIRQSIFLFESGSNDIFNYFIPFEPPTLDPDAFVHAMLTEVGNFIEQIYKLGARRIAVFALGPVGCVPARTLLPGAPITRCYGKMNRMVKNYNLGLDSLVKDIPNKYPGAVGVYGAVYNIVQQFRLTPKHYGNATPLHVLYIRFSNTSSACCGDGTLRGMLQCGKEGYKICESPNEFLFWDYFHPSEHTYMLISKALWGGKQSWIRPLNLKTLANITLTPS
ncbi:hypothetical protein HHK36_024582 [Tetracentron sinense]|uniref:GDSL esterase/lipase 6 n=1 Tax=Tetracentron sinense TaxID=13715 RepID=A0A835D4S3_TETSI|nr:hypothetical protein HHK36_024582 [Tetracentron sinense]